MFWFSIFWKSKIQVINELVRLVKYKNKAN